RCIARNRRGDCEATGERGSPGCHYIQLFARACQQVVDGIVKDGGKALAIKADASDQPAVRAAIQQAGKAFGKIDILVNNAGVLALGAIAEFPVEDFEKALSVNVRSVFTAIQEVLRHMPDGGRIITIGSVNSERMPFVGGSVYALTKGAI